MLCYNYIVCIAIRIERKGEAIRCCIRNLNITRPYRGVRLLDQDIIDIEAVVLIFEIRSESEILSFACILSERNAKFLVHAILFHIAGINGDECSEIFRIGHHTHNDTACEIITNRLVGCSPEADKYILEALHIQFRSSCIYILSSRDVGVQTACAGEGETETLVVCIITCTCRTRLRMGVDKRHIFHCHTILALDTGAERPVRDMVQSPRFVLEIFTCSKVLN